MCQRNLKLYFLESVCTHCTLHVYIQIRTNAMELLTCTISRLKVCFISNYTYRAIIQSKCSFVRFRTLYCGVRFHIILHTISYCFLGSSVHTICTENTVHTAEKKTALILPQSAICNLILFYEKQKKKTASARCIQCAVYVIKSQF